jgi:hypothetical protein
MPYNRIPIWLYSEKKKLLSELTCAVEPGECLVLQELVTNFYFYCGWYCWSNINTTVHFCAVYFKVGFFLMLFFQRMSHFTLPKS